MMRALMGFFLFDFKSFDFDTLVCEWFGHAWAALLVMAVAGSVSAQSVDDFTLIDANSDLAIAGFDPMPNASVIHLNLTPQINIRANTSGALGSVV
ncbi:MAG: hypothetical protein AAGH65_12630, partial [Pseudomonadota bacterium]